MRMGATCRSRAAVAGIDISRHDNYQDESARQTIWSCRRNICRSRDRHSWYQAGALFAPATHGNHFHASMHRINARRTPVNLLIGLGAFGTTIKPKQQSVNKNMILGKFDKPNQQIVNTQRIK